jgi:hypothetical protein
MKTCEYAGDAPLPARAHPWTDAAANAEFRYYDLKASPALIRTSLEDFSPWSRYAAIGRFYDLLEWINGGASELESNDCAFAGTYANENLHIRKSRECSGRVMLLFRDLARNVSSGDIKALTNALHRALAPADPSFELGVIGTTLVPVRYVTLPLPEDAQLGSELMVSFWTWGDTDAESMHNLDRLMTNLSRALHAVAAAL